MFYRLQNIGTNLSTFVLALVPVFKSCPPCPICMPKYAALFAFFGLELADYSNYLVPVMFISMGLSLGSMYYQISKKHLVLYPFIGALSSCLLILISKFLIGNESGTYIGMLGLFGSIVMHYQSISNYQSPNKSCCNK